MIQLGTCQGKPLLTLKARHEARHSRFLVSHQLPPQFSCGWVGGWVGGRSLFIMQNKIIEALIIIILLLTFQYNRIVKKN